MFSFLSICAQIGVLTYVIIALKYNFYCIEDIGFIKYNPVVINNNSKEN